MVDSWQLEEDFFGIETNLRVPKPDWHF